MDTIQTKQFSELTTEIVAAYVGNNAVDRDEIAALIAAVHAALQKASQPSEPQPQPQDPAVPIRSSIRPDYIVCLEDGKKFKSLKRHLNSDHGMTPTEYRAKWGLKSDYPMVAPNYAAARSNLAKAIGLGRKAGSPKATEAQPVGGEKIGAAPKRRSRSKAKS